MINFIISIIAFIIEWWIIVVVLGLVYYFFMQYHVTRYLVSYPGLLFLFNALGWAFSIVLCLFIGISNSFYNAFITDGPRIERDYKSLLNVLMIISTICMTFIGLLQIIKDEKSYWEDRKQSTKP